MKRLWVNVVPYNKQIAIAALESGAEAIVLPEGQSDTVRQFGRIKTVENQAISSPAWMSSSSISQAKPTRTGLPPCPRTSSSC